MREIRFEDLARKEEHSYQPWRRVCLDRAPPLRVRLVSLPLCSRAWPVASLTLFKLFERYRCQQVSAQMWLLSTCKPHPILMKRLPRSSSGTGLVNPTSHTHKSNSRCFQAGCMRAVFPKPRSLASIAEAVFQNIPDVSSRRSSRGLQFCRRFVLALSSGATTASLRMSVSSSLAFSDQNATCPTFSGPISRF